MKNHKVHYQINPEVCLLGIGVSERRVTVALKGKEKNLLEVKVIAKVVIKAPDISAKASGIIFLKTENFSLPISTQT